MIVFDTNEANKRDYWGNKVLDKLLDRIEDAGVPIDEQPMDTGDAWYLGRGEDGKLSVSIGYEFKIFPNDFFASMRDGRIMTQLPRMVSEEYGFDIPVLVLIGDDFQVNFTNGLVKEKKKQKWVDSPYSFHYISSILSRFRAAGGRIEKVHDLDHLASYLISSYQFWRKDTHSPEVFVRKRHSFMDWRQLDNPLAEFYERISERKHGKNSGIGIKRALALTEAFPNPMNLMIAPVEILQEIDVDGRKFGPVNARKVYRFLHEDHGTGEDGKVVEVRT